MINLTREEYCQKNENQEEEEEDSDKQNLGQGTLLINRQLSRDFHFINRLKDISENQQSILQKAILNVRFPRGGKLAFQLILRQGKTLNKKKSAFKLLRTLKDPSYCGYQQSEQKTDPMLNILQKINSQNNVYRGIKQQNFYLQYLDGLNKKNSAQSKKFLSSKNKLHINQMLMPLHNPSQCLQCVKQYVQFKPYPSKKQLYTVISFDQNQELFDQKMKQKICGLLNLNGGYLVIAKQEKQYVTGTVKLHQKVHYWQEYYIKNIRNFIVPKEFHIGFDEVEVLSKENDQKKVIRIKVLPSDRFQTYFVEKNVDNRTFTYNFCQLNFKSEKIRQVYTLEQPHQFYKIIYRKYYQRIKFKKKYTGVLGANYFKIGYRQCIPNYIQLLNKINIGVDKLNPDKFEPHPNSLETVLSEPKYKKIEDEIPLIVYKHQSVIMLSDALGNRLINELAQSLKEANKQCFSFVRPYTSYRSKSKKQIWFVSHEYPLPEIQKHIHFLNSPFQNKFLAIITVTKYLIVESREEEQLEQLKKAFLDIFGYEIVPEKETIMGNNKTFNFYFMFREYQDSVFSFIFLDNIRIRAQFYKETHYFDKMQTLKKTKNKKYKQVK